MQQLITLPRAIQLASDQSSTDCVTAEECLAAGAITADECAALLRAEAARAQRGAARPA